MTQETPPVAPEIAPPARKRRALKFVVGAAIAAAVLLVLAAATFFYVKPPIRAEGFDIVQRKDTSFTYTLNLAVLNPLPVDARIDAYEFTLTVNGDPLAHSKVFAPIDLPGFQKTTIPISIEGYEQELPDFLQMGRHEMPPRRDFHYKLTGWVDLGRPLRHRHSFDYEGTIPAFKIPDAVIHALRIERMDLFNPRMVLELEITNPNALAFTHSDFQADVMINRIPIGKVASREPVEYPPRSTTVTPFHFQIESIRGAAGALSILYKGEVLVRLKGTVYAEVKGIGKFPFEFDKEGPAPVYLQQLAPGLAPR